MPTTKQGGMTREEVLRIFPQTKEEDRGNDAGHMKDEIGTLDAKRAFQRLSVNLLTLQT
jgi:hypothetical protein